jgi:hypothetical protein
MDSSGMERDTGNRDGRAAMGDGQILRAAKELERARTQVQSLALLHARSATTAQRRRQRQQQHGLLSCADEVCCAGWLRTQALQAAAAERKTRKEAEVRAPLRLNNHLAADACG